MEEQSEIEDCVKIDDEKSILIILKNESNINIAKKVYEINKNEQFHIGRNQCSQLDIPSPFFSRNHCIIYFEQETAFIKNLSRTDILVGRKSVKPNQSCVLNNAVTILSTNFPHLEFKYFSSANDMKNDNNSLESKRKMFTSDVSNSPNKKLKSLPLSDAPDIPLSGAGQTSNSLKSQLENVDINNYQSDSKCSKLIAEFDKKEQLILENKDLKQKLEETRELLLNRIKNIEENLKSKEASLKICEENLKCAEESLKSKEASLISCEEKLYSTKENLKSKEASLKICEEKLYNTKESLKSKEASLKICEEKLYNTEESLKSKEASLKICEEKFYSTKESLKSKEASLKICEEKLYSTEESLKSKDVGLKICEENLNRTEERLKSKEACFEICEENLKIIEESLHILEESNENIKKELCTSKENEMHAIAELKKNEKNMIFILKEKDDLLEQTKKLLNEEMLQSNAKWEKDTARKVAEKEEEFQGILNQYQEELESLRASLQMYQKEYQISGSANNNLTEIAEVIESELQCGICNEIIIDAYTLLKCFHTFCEQCISQWKRRKPECPVCRTKIIKNQGKRNFHLDSLISNLMSKMPLEMQKQREEGIQMRRNPNSKEQSTSSEQRVTNTIVQFQNISPAIASTSRVNNRTTYPVVRLLASAPRVVPPTSPINLEVEPSAIVISDDEL